MLNSNFDLRTFLTESKNPTISEGAKFKVGDMVKLSGGEPTEVLAVRKMTDSDLHAYSIKNSKGERAEYDETQLSAANVDEVLSEATVMEYIRERMDRMNDEVRSCMKEYIQACNEIDPGHEDAHAQLMSALEDFYNKLKAHFEQDEAEMEEPLATNDEVPHIDLEEGPVYPEDKHTMTPDEFGGEEDEVNEEEVEEGNAFSVARAKAIEDGNDEFEVDGKTYKVNETEDMIEEDYEPRTKEDLIFQYLRDAWQFGAMKGKDVDPDEELSTMTDSLLANLPDYDASNVDEEVVSEGLDPETVKLLLGMAKLAVTAGTVPAALGILYQYRDNPKIAKAIQAFEKHLDK